jgi:hypothetical protein
VTAHVDKMQHVAMIRPRLDGLALGKPGAAAYIGRTAGDESVKGLRGTAGIGSVALLAAALLAAPASLAQTGRARVSTPVGSFTPAVSDPRLAAALARRSAGSSGFRFTPATAAVERRQPVRVAVRARAANPQEPVRIQSASATPVTAITPSSYNLGASVGWHRFAISGDVAETRDGVVSGRRSSAQVGMSYQANTRITARVQASAEIAEGRQRTIADDQAYAVDVGGSYSVARNVDVTGGVRYRVSRDRIEPIAADQRRDSQAVYIGTAFRF